MMGIPDPRQTRVLASLKILREPLWNESARKYVVSVGTYNGSSPAGNWLVQSNALSTAGMYDAMQPAVPGLVPVGRLMHNWAWARPLVREPPIARARMPPPAL